MNYIILDWTVSDICRRKEKFCFFVFLTLWDKEISRQIGRFDSVEQAEDAKAAVLTGCITSNPDSPMAAEADVAIEMIVGPEYVTGSSRMKSGTGQKMILNMITTSVMIQLGRVKGNKMVNMQLSNKKLVDRGTRMIVEIYRSED